MIELAKTSMTIAAPVDVIFNYVTNMENYKEWFPGIVDIESANDLPHGVVGKQYMETLSLPSGNFELIIEVVQCETNRRFVTKGNLMGVLPQMAVTFSVDKEDNCHVDLQYHSRSPGLTESSDIVIALRKDLAGRAEKAVAELKVIMESF